MTITLTNNGGGEILNARIHDHVLQDLLLDKLYLQNSGSPYDPVGLDTFLSKIDSGQSSHGNLPLITPEAQYTLEIAEGQLNIPVQLHYLEFRNLSTNNLDDAIGGWAQIFDFSTTTNACNAAQNGHLYVQASENKVTLPQVREQLDPFETVVSYGAVFRFNQGNRFLHGRLDPVAKVGSKPA